MASLGRRTPTAIAYGLVVLGALAAPGPWSTALIAALLLLGLIELAGLARRLGSARATVVAFAAGATVLVVGLASLLSLTSYAQSHGLVERPWVLVALVPTWIGDTIAYLMGSLVGRRRLAPRISPGKTWEGTLAGFLGAAAATVGVASVAFAAPPPPEIVAIVALAIGPVGLLGDLAESALKRAAAVKDSGTLLPGHGGVLDRIDSLMGAAPLVAIAMTMGRTLG